MSGQWFVLRLLTGCVFGGMMAWFCFSRFDPEVGEDTAWNGRRYLAYLPSLLLPVFFPMLICIYWPQLGARKTVEVLFSLCFHVFVSMSLYYVLLGVLLPVVRRRVSARGCAMLWLLPNYLYIMGQWQTLPEPWLVIRMDSRVFYWIVALWLFGFTAVLLYKVVQHSRFRRYLLKNAYPVTDEEILTIWREEIAYAGAQPRASVLENWLGLRSWNVESALVLSPDTATPLSLGGIRWRATRVVLPEKHYTPEEVRLVLRHELVHICRGDGANKFFLMFCRALCWFHPLVWWSTRRGAEDLELSCDETVLLDADGDTRRRYAGLLLETAGDERGFTTCLAASASALRYRLRRVMKPGKGGTGALAVFLAFVLLCMSYGYVAVAVDAGTASQAVFGRENLTELDITTIGYQTEGGFYEACTSEMALLEYLAGLKVSRLAGQYALPEGEPTLWLVYTDGRTSWSVTVSNGTVWLLPLHERRAQYQAFLLENSVDWTYIGSLME